MVSNQEKNYNFSLTWLRAIAAFFVVVSHSIRATEVKYAEIDQPSFFYPFNFFDLGAFGVYLFFALSGCTLYLSNGNKLKAWSDVVKFIIKRFFRIWPTFAFSLIIYIFFIEVFKVFYNADSNLWIGQFLKKYTLGNIFQYLSLTFNWTGPRGLFQGTYWSLPIEFQYYLLLPVATFFMKGRIKPLIIPIFISIVLYICYDMNIFGGNCGEFFKMAFSFFGGISVAYLSKIRHYRFPYFFSLSIFFVCILTVGLLKLNLITVSQKVPFFNDTENLYGILAIFLIFIALNTKQSIPNNFFFSLLTEYGEISYSIYLFHMLFVGISILIIVNLHIYGDSIKLFFTFSFTLIGSFIFSKFTFKYLELPSINVGKVSIKKFSQILE